MTNQNNKKDAIVTHEPHDIFELFDKLDDRVIIAELEHKVVDTWVYHFIQDGKDIWGVGKAGIDGCSDMLSKKGIALREDWVRCEPDPIHPEYLLFSASVTKYLVAKDGTEIKTNSAIGTKRQWIMIKRRDGRIASNKFWYEQGSIKALRNAKARLIDDEIKSKIIAYSKKHKKVKTIEVSEKKTEIKSKPEETRKPIQKTETETSGQKSIWPGEKVEEEPENQPFEKATQSQLMNITRLEATLIDKYGFKPDELIEKLEEKFGVSNITGISSEQAQDITEFFEETIKLNVERIQGSQR